MVKELLNAKQRNWFLKKSDSQHIYVYCRSRNIANRFLRDAQAEGFTFGDGMLPTEKETSDIFAITPDFTICYTGWAGHVSFHNAENAKNIVRIDYGKYISGSKDYLMR